MTKKRVSISFIKWFSLLAAILIVPIGILLLSTSYSYNKMLNQERLEKNILYVNQIIKVNEQITASIVNYVNKFAFSNEIKGWFSDESTIYATSGQFGEMKRVSEFIDSVYLYSPATDRVLSNDLRSADVYEFFDNSWFQHIHKSDNVPYKYVFRECVFENYKMNIVSIIKHIDYTNTNGYIIINLNPQMLKREYNLTRREYGLNIYDEYRELVFTGGKGLESLTSEDFARIYNNSGGSVKFLNEKKNIIYASDAHNWKYVYYNNPDDTGVGKVKVLYIVLDFVAIIWALAFIIFVTFQIIRPFKTIRAILVTAAINESMPISGNENSENDLNYIISLITKTLTDRDTYKVELEKKLELLRNMQLKVLNNQIRPHFLNNTLIAIRFMAMDITGGENNVSKALTQLAGLLEMTIENKQFVMFSEEIKYIKMYVGLHNIRYNDCIKLHMNIESETNGIMVMQFLLQPFVENSISHLNLESGNEGNITISSRIEGKWFIIEIEDDGEGMSETSVNKFNSISEYRDTGKHVGIRNVVNRLYLLYKDDFNFSVSSEINVGTKITIILPLDYNY